MKCQQCYAENLVTASYCAVCGAKLPSPEEMEAAAAETAAAPREELVKGSTFAERYQIIGELGKGSMGKVYQVLDKKLNEEVALKLINREIAADKRAIERLRNELKFARGISHKNICRMYDLNEEKGTYYVTMEYVPGENTKRLIRRSGPISTGKAISIAEQICEGLAAAHRLGIVHRRLKPSNIMIDQTGSVKIMDFGMARPLKTKGLADAGAIFEAPQYMSPEQVEGKEGDRRSDIYSLGAILYEVVTGRVPFEGNTPSAIGLKHKTEIPKNPKELNAHIPEDFSRLILKCLEKDKEKRPQSCTELRSYLEKIEKGIPMTERAVPTKKLFSIKEIAEKIRLKRLFIAGLVLIFIVILGIIIWRQLPQKGAAPPPPKSDRLSIALLPFEDSSPAKDHEYLCEGMAESLINALKNIQGLWVPAWTSSFSFKGKSQDRREIGRRLGVENLLETSVKVEANRLRISAKLINAEDGAPIWSSQYDRYMEGIFAIQEEIAQEIVKALKISLPGGQGTPLVKNFTKNLEAYNFYLQARYFWNRKGKESLEKAAEYFQKAVEKDPAYALAYAGLADTYAAFGINSLWPPEQAFPKARAAALKALEIDRGLAEAHASFAAIKGNYDWDFGSAEREYQEAIRIKPNSATAHQGYAWLLSALGRHEAAIAEMKLARALDPLSPRINADFGGILYFARQYDQALEELNKALEMDPSHSKSYIYRGMVYIQMGQYEEASKSFRRAMGLGGASEDMSLWIAYIDALSGKRQEAGRALDKAIKSSDQIYIPTISIAAVFAGLGERDQVLAGLEKAFTERDAGVVFLKVYPVFDLVRSDPRFIGLLRKIGLEK